MDERTPAAAEQATAFGTEQDLDHGLHDLPHHSLWPITLAAGLGMLAFGLLTTWMFSVVGVCLAIVAIAGWIEELRHA